jgi:cob(I)alamin adenosyltransferase
MLYTGKGDNGTTKLFTTPSGVRISKASLVTEALGTVDEINAFIGLIKVSADKQNISLGENGPRVAKVLHDVQQKLFIIQAELAGSDMHIEESMVISMSDTINGIEALLPPITTFFISGGTELAAQCDICRTVSRRAERAVIRACEAGECVMADSSKAYLNRLSSLLYAFARLSNHFSGITEEPPTYR